MCLAYSHAFLSKKTIVIYIRKKKYIFDLSTISEATPEPHQLTFTLKEASCIFSSMLVVDQSDEFGIHNVTIASECEVGINCEFLFFCLLSANYETQKIRVKYF